MEGSSLIAAIARALELLFAVIVLGLSASLHQDFSNARDLCNDESEFGCNFLGVIPALAYGIFVGVFGIIDAAVGIVGIFASAIPWIVTTVIDGLAAIFFLAGGIRLAVLVDRIDCTSGISFCSKLQADTAFMFLGCFTALALIGVGFFFNRKSGVAHSSV